jgi:hypothetical protein
MNANRFPSGVKDHGSWLFLLWVKGCGLPNPSERVTDMPSPGARNAMYRPSGLHKGALGFPVKVKRVIVSRCQS